MKRWEVEISACAITTLTVEARTESEARRKALANFDVMDDVSMELDVNSIKCLDTIEPCLAYRNLPDITFHKNIMVRESDGTTVRKWLETTGKRTSIAGLDVAVTFEDGMYHISDIASGCCLSNHGYDYEELMQGVCNRISHVGLSNVVANILQVLDESPEKPGECEVS